MQKLDSGVLVAAFRLRLAVIYFLLASPRDGERHLRSGLSSSCLCRRFNLYKQINDRLSLAAMADDIAAVSQAQLVDLPSFRPSKRRKVFRRREASATPPPASSTDHAHLEHPPEDAATEISILHEPSVTEIMRQRKAIQRLKGGGIGFSANKSAIDTADLECEGTPNTTTQRTMEVRTVASRFAPQTGQVKEVMDKHM